MGAVCKLQCLLVEDEALIGMALQSSVEETGWWGCDLVHSAGEALRCLERAQYDAAIVEYTLQDGPCTGLAFALRSRRIPFLVYSGYRRPRDAPSVLREVLWIEKPVDHNRVARALTGLTERSSVRLSAAL